jgi:hypothetical protein
MQALCAAAEPMASDTGKSEDFIRNQVPKSLNTIFALELLARNQPYPESQPGLQAHCQQPMRHALLAARKHHQPLGLFLYRHPLQHVEFLRYDIGNVGLHNY